MEIKGDFLSFKFGGVDCADLGIVRTSDGDRIEEQLQPDIKDITAEVPGMHGEYYFGSTYGNKTISVSFAFDDMSEAQFRQMRRHFGVGQIQELIFSERPYKRYLAKIASPIELSYVCFDEEGTKLVNFNGIYGVTTVKRSNGTKQRVYKGDGKIEFVCYFPFAKSCYKTLPIKNLNNVYEANLDEWKESSGILDSTIFNTRKIDVYDETNERIRVYNAGDVDCGFRLYIPFSEENIINSISLGYTINSKTQAQLNLSSITKKDNDVGVLIDTINGLITGVSTITTDDGVNYDYTTSGNLYNQYITSGYFFKLQPNTKTDTAYIKISGEPSTPLIFYDYLYF